MGAHLHAVLRLHVRLLRPRSRGAQVDGADHVNERRSPVVTTLATAASSRVSADGR